MVTSIRGRVQDFPDHHMLLAVPSAPSRSATSASLVHEFRAAVALPAQLPSACEGAVAMKRLAKGFRAQQWTLAGNAVPVNVARHLGATSLHWSGTLCCVCAWTLGLRNARTWRHERDPHPNRRSRGGPQSWLPLCLLATCMEHSKLLAGR